MRRFAMSSILPAVVILALGALGCRAGSANDAAPIARAEYCSTLAKAQCGSLVSCCHDAGVTTDDATCLSREQRACEALSADAESKGYVYDPQAAGNCHAGATLFHDGCAARQPGFWESRDVVDACSRIFHGTAALGATCRVDEDCAPSDEALVGCRRDATTGSGSCAAIPRANRGEVCNLKAGDASTFIACKSDAICTGEGASAGAPVITRCMGPSGIGQPCDPGDGRTCADGLFCHPDTKQCLRPRGLGESCAAVPCAEPHVCQPTTNLCVDRIGVGDACRASDLCAIGASCIATRCAQLLPEGAACNEYIQCQSYNCTLTGASSGTCGKVYGGTSSNGVDLYACRAIEVK